MAATLRTRALLLIVALGAPWKIGAAQSSPQPADPTATVRAFWTAVLALRWADAVDLLDLRDLDTARRMQVEYARAPHGREYGVEDMLRRDPDMPRAAAEYEVRRREKMRREYPARLFPYYFGIDSADQLDRMPIEDVAVRWIQGHDVLWQMAQQRKGSRCPPSEWVDSIASMRRPTVYGAVMAGSDTALVVFRVSWFPMAQPPEVQGVELEPLRIATVRRLQSGWRIRSVEELLQGSGGSFGLLDCPGRS